MKQMIANLSMYMISQLRKINENGGATAINKHTHELNGMLKVTDAMGIDISFNSYKDAVTNERMYVLVTIFGKCYFVKQGVKAMNDTKIYVEYMNKSYPDVEKIEIIRDKSEEEPYYKLIIDNEQISIGFLDDLIEFIEAL